MTKLPVPLTVPPVTRVAGLLLDRDRLAGDHRLVDRAAALDDDAVHRNSSRRAARADVADVTVAIGTSTSSTIADDARGLRRQAEQLPDRRARPASRARSSSTWPSSTSTVMTTAVSK